MAPWQPTIIYIFSLILAINSLTSFVFWRTTKNRLFLKAGIAWSAYFANFAIHAASQNRSTLSLVGYACCFIAACSLSSILCDTAHLKFKSKNFVYAGISILVGSLLIFHETQNYFFAALTLDLFIAFPMLYYSFKALKQKSSHILVKVLAVLLIITAIHFLNYPFLNNHATGIIWFFSIVFFLSILISILLHSLFLQMSSRKYTNELESLVLERTAKLESINKDNITLLSIVCHDISTPVMIANYSLSKLTSSLENLNFAGSLDIQKIQNNLNAVVEILNRVKDIHSVKLGKLEPQIQSLDVETLICEVIQMYQPLCEKKEISIEFIAKNQILKKVLLDPVLFKNQILGNLISNAIKFSEKGQKIEIHLVEKNDFIQIDVVDYGRGIAHSKFSKIFEINHPTSTRGTDSEVGSGLGLPTAKAIIEKMAGEISVSNRNIMNESDMGKGTVFSLRFKAEI